MKKIEGGVTTIYVNKYYEKTGTTVTTYYYLGGKLVANRVGAVLSYILQDHLGSTSVTASSAGATTSTIRYFGFGDCRNSTGTVPTDKKFTGQRLDQTGLYYYGARYYDATIGRFISPDPVISSAPIPIGDYIGSLTVSFAQLKWLSGLNQRSGTSKNILVYNPKMSYQVFMSQEMNRYSYALNNPLRYIDPEGNQAEVIYYYLYQILGGLLGAITGEIYSNQPTNTRDLEKAINIFLDDFGERCSWFADKISSGLGWLGGKLQGLFTSSTENTADGETSSDKVEEAVEAVGEWLGEGAVVKQTKDGDLVVVSEDGQRRFRVDINDTSPHENPHAHLEELINGEWIRSGPIFPWDVPQK